MDRYNAATAEREAAGFASDSERARVLMAEIRVGLELGRSNLADAVVGLRVHEQFAEEREAESNRTGEMSDD